MRMQGCVSVVWTLLVVFAVGCGASSGEPAASDSSTEQSGPRIVGRWHGEVWLDESQASQVLNPEHVAALKATTMDVAFEADGKMTLSGVNDGEPYTSEGRWELVQHDGPTMVIKSIEAAGREKELQVRFDSDDVFSMSLPEPVTRIGAMQFKRLR